MLIRTILFSVALLVLPQTLMGQETVAPNDNLDMLAMIQNSKKITVNRAGRERSFTMYSPEIVYFSGVAYIKGGNAASNPSGYYFAALDKIEMMTIPNPDYVESKQVAKAPREVSVEFQLAVLERKARNAERESEELRREVARKRISIGSLKRRVESLGDDDSDRNKLQTQIELLSDEMEHQKKQLVTKSQEADDLQLEYLKKRRDATVSGKLDK